MAKERKCVVCAKIYEYCPHCGKKNSYDEAWRMIYCSEDCMAIDKIRDNYVAGKFTKDEAKALIEQHNIPLTFEDWCKDAFIEILSGDIEIVIEEAIAEPEIIIDEAAEYEQVDEQVDVQTSSKNRRNKKNVNELNTEE